MNLHRRILSIALKCFVSCSVFALSIESSCASGENEVIRFVQVSQAKLRTQPQLWSPGLADLIYGQALTLVGENGGWIKVRTAGGAEGFVPLSAVSLKKVLLRGNTGEVKIRAGESDIVLAGKGFSSSLEELLRSSDATLNFESVDAMEADEVDDGKLFAFVSDGHLVAEPK